MVMELGPPVFNWVSKFYVCFPQLILKKTNKFHEKEIKSWLPKGFSLALITTTLMGRVLRFYILIREVLEPQTAQVL